MLPRLADGHMTLTRSLLCALTPAALVSPVILSPAVAQQPAVTIEKLIAEGWEVAGYVAAWENRTLILFKHKEHKYLVQCSVLIDVMRNPRLVTACYELR
jgi:predicted metal-binding membrane protein